MLLLIGAPRGTDYQVTLDGTEVGAAWKKTARESGKAYLSVKRVSPFLAVPINCALMARTAAFWCGAATSGSKTSPRGPPPGSSGWRPFPFQSWHDDDANFVATE